MKKKRVKKKANAVRDYYTSSWEYLKESKKYVFWSVAAFIAASIIGFAFPEIFAEYFDKILKELVIETEGLNAFQLIVFIFRNNFMAALLGVVSGVFLGIIPAINIITNGLILGYVISLGFTIIGAEVILRLVPHGIFELPAIFISIGLGLKLGGFVFAGKNWLKELKRRLFSSLKVFVAFVIPLLVVAAVIEGLLIALSS